MQPGLFVAVVGPSGAGKDTLLDRARVHFAGHPQVHFVRRVVTRASDAGGEDHQAMAAGEFSRRRLAGDFAVDWDAHGLSYGIPATVRDALACGGLVIANGSRAALPRFRAVFPRLAVVLISADPAVIATRLAVRGRESAADIQARLSRATLAIDAGVRVIAVDNSGTVDEGARRLIAAFERLASEAAGVPPPA